MAKKKEIPSKPARPIHIRNFGCATELSFIKGGTVKIHMDASAMRKLLGAMQKYFLRKPRIPDPKILAALDTLYAKFDWKYPDIEITADVVIAQQGVKLEPILMDYEDIKKELDER